MAAAIFQTASSQLLVPPLESLLGRERLPGLAHGWFCSEISQTKMIQHLCVSLIAQKLPQLQALSSRQAAENFCSLLTQPQRGEQTQHCAQMGFGCPRTAPSCRAGIFSRSPKCPMALLGRCCLEMCQGTRDAPSLNFTVCPSEIPVFFSPDCSLHPWRRSV